MTTKELIESGKLELLVSGTLCGKEKEQVLSMVKSDPILQQEVEAIEIAFMTSLTESSVVPSVSVKEKVLAAVQAESKGKVRSISPTPAQEISKPATTSINYWLAAASVALLISLGATFFVFDQKLNSQNTALATLKATQEKEALAQQNEIENYSNQLALLNDVNTKRVLLNGVGSTPEAIALIYWNASSGKVLINPSALPEPPSDKQYQLWALLDGKPIDAGVFDINKDSVHSLQELKNIPNAQAFAVTLETKGGVASPTLTAMYVMGLI